MRQVLIHCCLEIFYPCDLRLQIGELPAHREQKPAQVIFACCLVGRMTGNQKSFCIEFLSGRLQGLGDLVESGEGRSLFAVAALPPADCLHGNIQPSG